MWFSSITGNLGRDAEQKQAGNSTVCEFSVAHTRKYKGEENTTWIRCSLWGARGESLLKHLRKGAKVSVSGETWTREYNGKTYVEMRVADLDPFCGGKGSVQSSDRHRDEDAPKGSTVSGGAYADEDYGGSDDDDSDLPF